MPEFVLRYDGRAIRQEAEEMARAVAATAAEVFGMEVVWEARPFEATYGQPSFAVTGWVTDNQDELVDVVLAVRAAVLQTMQTRAYEDQRVECWWQRVKGRWSAESGLMRR